MPSLYKDYKGRIKSGREEICKYISFLVQGNESKMKKKILFFLAGNELPKCIIAIIYRLKFCVSD